MSMCTPILGYTDPIFVKINHLPGKTKETTTDTAYTAKLVGRKIAKHLH